MQKATAFIYLTRDAGSSIEPVKMWADAPEPPFELDPEGRFFAKGPDGLYLGAATEAILDMFQLTLSPGKFVYIPIDISEVPEEESIDTE